ncbi:hypothetical protein LJY25_08145 [Hymenobacter sp. BT175]|uniref:hypothetical protein n=1 Tax=Hymenobacter translucens TaxID=2886507 RepID=UPI001D0DE590|nr:hypothetical protein [Hymenobacter translucens]MCC2546412.1 hypothetical protein [Hymenobacter translucens]
MSQHSSFLQERRRVYVNAKQAAFLSARQKRRSFVGGRGSGKSSVLGHKTRQEFNYLPRAKFFLAGLTYNQILTKTLPSAMDSWAAHGLVEYDLKNKVGHYVVGKRPPRGWILPYQAPRNYENCISFINGYTIEMLSFDRPDTARGGNYDGGHLDESALFKREHVAKILLPMIRGNIYRFNHWLHQSFCDYTSAAWLPEGQWVYETEELAKTDPDEYFFLESTAYDNVAVLGEKYLAKLRKEMSQLEWDVEVMNVRLKKLPNSFYPNFSADRHSSWKTFSYEYDEATGLHLPSTTDCDTKRPLELSWDFNAAFTSMLVCQEHGREFRILDEVFVKESDTNMLDAVVTEFGKRYADHQNKTVYIYGDRNGNNKQTNSPLTFYQQIQQALSALGWASVMMVQGLDPDHRLKHFALNDILSETKERLPLIRINRNKCKYTIISIQNTPINPDWTKNKKSERKLLDQAQATHLSDCFDNIVYRKFCSLFGQQVIESPVYFLSGRRG